MNRTPIERVIPALIAMVAPVVFHVLINFEAAVLAEFGWLNMNVMYYMIYDY